MTGVEDEEVRRSNFGWSPVYASDTLGVMSVGKLRERERERRERREREEEEERERERREREQHQ